MRPVRDMHIAQVVTGSEYKFAAKCREHGGWAIVFEGLRTGSINRGKRSPPKPYILIKGYVIFGNCFARKQWDLIKVFYDSISQSEIDTIQIRIDRGDFDDAKLQFEKMRGLIGQTIEISDGVWRGQSGIITDVNDGRCIVVGDHPNGTFKTTVAFNEIS